MIKNKIKKEKGIIKMTIEECKKIIYQMQKEENISDEQILNIFYRMYFAKKISFEELEALVDAMGYELSKDFLDCIEFNPDKLMKKEYENKKFNYNNNNKTSTKRVNKNNKKEAITIDQAYSAMKQMMDEGTTEDDMLGILYLMFQNDKISLDELEALINKLGYEFTEEFINMTPEQKKTDGYTYEDDSEEDDIDWDELFSEGDPTDELTIYWNNKQKSKE